MKKKIINGILLVALVFATSSAFVSCKDNDADVNTELLGKIASLKAELEDVKGRIPSPYTYDDTAVKNAIAGLENKVAELEEKINNLEPGTTYDDTEIKAAIELLQAEIDTLASESEALANIIYGLVFGITAEGTYNPVFGALGAPVGVTSNILAAYYGDGKAMSFHGEKITNFFNKDAGTIYFTVNPTEAKLTGAFSLVNSQDVPAKVTLTAAESDKVLTWGWNQTRNASGLYAANVTIDDLDAVKFDYNDIAGALKDAISKRTKSSIINLVTELYATVAGDKFPRLALKYTSNEDLIGATTVRTGYDFGITAIKPLSYDFDVNISKTPGIDRLEAEINKIINKINIDFGIDFSKFKNVTINLDRNGKDYIVNVKVDVPVDETVTVNIPNVDVNVDVPGQTIPVTLSYVDDDGVSHPVTGNVDVPGQTVPVTVEIPATAVALNFTVNTSANVNINEVVDDLFNGLNGDLAEINAMLNEVSKLSNLEAEIENTKSDIKSQISSYLRKFDQKFVQLVNSANKALQPTLLVKSGNKITRTGNVKAGNIKLIPTSYTAEVIAPAFKKYINVECDGKAINGESFGKVIDGSVSEIDLNIEAGKTYKVTYDAVDFFGKTRSNTYYIYAK